MLSSVTSLEPKYVFMVLHDTLVRTIRIWNGMGTYEVTDTAIPSGLRTEI